MSFSQSVKEEIFKNIKKPKGCCATSFLVAVLKSIGSLCVDTLGYNFSVETDNGDLLMFCAELAQNTFAADTFVYQINSADEGKNPKYVGKFDVSLGEKLNLTYNDGDGLHITSTPDVDLSKPCCRRSFMQALFLSCGSASIPSVSETLYESARSNYHLELRFSNAPFAEFVQRQFAELDFKQTSRKNSIVLYLKDSAKIADFFVFVDAVNAKFTVENIIIGRSFRNDANRQRNCIDSNIDKALLASEKHLAAIEKIRSSGKFDMLPSTLQEVAVAREQHPEANLAELAATLQISKSGVNHRLAKLLDIAEDLK